MGYYGGHPHVGTCQTHYPNCAREWAHIKTTVVAQSPTHKASCGGCKKTSLEKAALVSEALESGAPLDGLLE